VVGTVLAGGQTAVDKEEDPMDVTIIGTGNMARAIGTRLLAGRNNVTVLGKDAESAGAVADELRAQAPDGATVQVGSSGDPLSDDVIVLAVYYPDAKSAVEQYGDQLAGKVVVDITNPVNESYDGLVTPPDGSATQELAAAAPEAARFVKAFNTTFARTLAAGNVAGEPLDVFIAGDDPDAKATISELVEGGGLRGIDAGPLHRARELEAVGLLHITLQGTLGTGGKSALKILA
jgi:predicted dinucleotide-binding enzyme